MVSPDYGSILATIADKMPSFRSLSTLAASFLALSQSVLGYVAFPGAIRNRASETCSSPQLSCHNTSAVADLCCFNAPGGTLLQTQFWDTDPPTGPSNSWTIHGLWPDNCDGTYQSNCDSSRTYTNITQILQAMGDTDTLSYMQTYWKDYQGDDESFWEHEWGKHGTCISTLDPTCYADYQPTQEVPDFFNRVVSLFKTLPTYQWLAAAGITPSTTATYTSSQIQAALSTNFGYQVYLGCSSGALNEVWYFYNVRGSVQSGDFVATDLVGSGSTCPSTGVKYLPKSSGSASPTSTTGTTGTTTATATPTSTGGAFSGKGVLNVVASGSQDGCIISAGTWYTSGTCATFTAAAAANGAFTLTSSKGSCGVVSGALTCGSGVASSTFTAVGSLLAYDGADTFYADGVPSGSTQGKVYTASSHTTSLQIQWKGN